MPQASPTGGLSLLIHIIINVIVFSYNRIIKWAKLPKKNWTSNFFDTLTSKKGETTARTFLAYTLVAFVFLVIGSNFVLITVKLFRMEDVRISSKIEQIIATKYRSIMSPSVEASNIVDEPLPSQSELLTYSVVDSITEPETNNPDTLRLSSRSFTSLIDFMAGLGILDTSFEARAEFARQSGVISSVEEYNGSFRQDMQVISKIQTELIAHIRPE